MKKDPGTRKPVLTNPVTVPAIILQLLDTEGDSYGRVLLDRIRECTNGKVMARWGSIYPALYHLQEGGLIEATGTVKGETGKARKMYRITELGRRKAAENRDTVLRLYGRRRRVVDTLFES